MAMKIKGPVFIGGVQFTEADAREYVSRLKTPTEAKRLGRNIEVRPDWNGVKLTVMEWGLRQKFSYGTPLADMLTDTGEEELVEGNNWGDFFWGRVDGKGENHLGRILMRIREELKEKNGN